MGATDLERWRLTAERTPPWDGRVAAIAARIPAGASIVDVGAGNMSLRQYVAASRYVPIDCVPTCPETVLADFNRGEYPSFPERFDYAVISGVLEHVDDPEALLQSTVKWAQVLIFTYWIGNHTEPDHRNHLSREQLHDICARLGLRPVEVGTWTRQTIFEVRP
jgi:hypothetical protein